MSLYAALKGMGPSGFGYGSTAEVVTRGVNLEGKSFVVTGCNSGIGKETMRVLCLRGADLIAVARTKDKALKAAADVGARVTAMACDLSEPAAVRDCARAIADLGSTIAAVICNAGIMAVPQLELKYGLELQFLTNHLGHFIFVTELLDHLRDDARVVCVSSNAHRAAPSIGIDFDNLDGSKGYRPWPFYGQSKLANLLFAKELARRFEGTAKVANAVHPGVIHTGLMRHMNPLAGLGLAIAGPIALKSPAQGAATQCYLAAHEDGAKHSGQYFSHCNVARPRRRAEDKALARKLWLRSEELKEALLRA